MVQRLQEGLHQTILRNENNSSFMRKNIEKVSKSVWTSAYLLLVSPFQVRSSIVGNSVSAVDAHQVF